MISDAIGIDRVANVIGYKLTGGDFQTAPNYLPQRIVILGKSNKTGTESADPYLAATASEVAEKSGAGSPVHMAMRILKPKFGGGVGSIPILVMPQVNNLATDVPKVFSLATVGTATADATHKIFVAGRDSIDGESYDFQVATGDTPAVIGQKIADAINSVSASPLVGFFDGTNAGLETKFMGVSAQEIDVYISQEGVSAGLTYTVTVGQAGNGLDTSAITTALEKDEEPWNTLIINCYGINKDVANLLEAYNGFPENATPTGRYEPKTHKPFRAITGYTSELDSGDLLGFVSTRNDQVTIALAPAPLSEATTWEAAANMVTVYAPIANETPHLDVMHRTYPDMPTPTLIGNSANYDKRDEAVKRGISTVTLLNGKYRIEDFVTTYNITDDGYPQWRYVRNFTVDANIKYFVLLKKEQILSGKVIVGDDDIISVDGAVKPKEWRSEMFTLLQVIGQLGLIADVPFAQESLQVGLSVSNPDRLETKFKYKRSGIYRILPTTVEAGFNFGTL